MRPGMTPAADIEGVLLDLDDTLVAFDSVSEPSWRQVCAEYCASRPSCHADRLFAAIKAESDRHWSDPERHRIGRQNLPEARRLIVGTAFASAGLPAADAVGLADRYSQLRLDNMHVLPGAEATLRWLRSAGYGCALVTNGDGPTQRWKIERFALAEYFATILIEGEVGYGKPDPRVYLAAVSALGLAPSRACMVGDNLDWDVRAPQQLGIRAAWVDRTGAGLPADSSVLPDWTIPAVSGLPSILGPA